MSVRIAPSILSADFAKLGDEVREIEAGGAEVVHVDVMDGHFVPNITIGPLVVKALRPVTKLPLDTHLMISEPDRYLEAFAKAGSDWLTVHAETCPHLHRTVQAIKALGCKAGVSLNPATPVEALDAIFDDLDLVLVMTVNPGFGGQAYIPSAARKLEPLSAWRRDRNPECLLEIDGGVNEANAGELAAMGADVLVAGNSVFGQPDRAAAIRGLHTAIEGRILPPA